MGFFDNFPYTNFHELNVDWVLTEFKKLRNYVEEYTAVNKVNYSGIWDITKQYPQWAVVSNGDRTYMSSKPVPVGIEIENVEYWIHLADIDPRIGGIITQLDEIMRHSLKFYGAVGDGVTDDSGALKSALAALDGETLYIDSGTFRIATPVTISQPITIVGGSDSKLKLESTLTIRHHVENVNIRGISFEGTAVPLIDCIGIGTVIDSCDFTSSKNILKVRNHDNVVQNCYFKSSGNSVAVIFDVLDGDDGVNWSVNNKLLNNTIYTEYIGVLCTKSTSAHLQEGLTITGNTILGNHGGSKCVVINALFAGLISDNIFDLAGQYALEIGGSGNSVSDIHVSANYLAGDSYGLLIGGQNSPQGCSVIGNTIYSKNGGFLVQNSREVDIRNNVVHASDHSFNIGGGAHYVKIESNTFLDGLQMGITNSPDKCFVRDNLCHHLSINGTGTRNNPTYQFDPEGHMTVTNTDNWSVWDFGNMIIE